ncbi:TniQ family protein [Caballeronia sp. GAWG1-1]|uniref:TniQ family protein n=1 Tax=Caballeronia sp. GAWG1-1 TaxID=2921742 RepID=UPI0032EA9551
MAVALRLPHLDEMLVGPLVEYVQEERVSNVPAFLKNLFGYDVKAFFDMLSGLDRLSEQTAQYWSCSAKAIARTLTAYPYHTASCSPAVAASVLELMRTSVGNVRDRRGLMFGRFVRLGEFRYCDQCVYEDRLAVKREYLHRSHQLPGVVVCHAHRCLLNFSPVRANLPFRPTARSEGPCIAGAPIDIGIRSDEVTTRWHDVARRSADVLTFALSSSMYCSRDVYRTQLKELGYVVKSGDVQLDDLSRHVTDYFTTGYLTRIGLGGGQRTRDWLASLLCGRQAVPMTLVHILLQSFIGSKLGKPTGNDGHF